MKKRDGLTAVMITFVVIFSVLISGCDIKDFDFSKVNASDVEKLEKLIVCNPPYIRYETGCCLDANNNSICDEHEDKEKDKEKEKKEECIDECSTDGCDDFTSYTCVKKEDRCRYKVSKGKVIGKCGVECLSDSDCSGDKKCFDYKCISEDIPYKEGHCTVPSDEEYEFVPFTKCSNTMRYFCVNATHYYDTMIEHCEGADGVAGYPPGGATDDCCPEGYYCPEVGAGCIKVPTGTCLNASLGIETKSGYTCYDKPSRQVVVMVSRGPQEFELGGVQILISVDGQIEKFDIVHPDNLLGKNQQKTFAIPLNETQGDATEVWVAPIIKLGDANMLCGMTAKTKLVPCR